MSSCVRLAAMMPAMRAAPSTSPFLASPLRMVASVPAVMRTKPSAMATRAVIALPPTSTMRASPRLSTWESFFAFAMCSPGGRDRMRDEQRARCGRHIGLTHQAFADQEGADTNLRKATEIGRRENAALADDDAVGWHARCQPLGRGERGLKSFEVAVVDADEARAQAQRALELGGVVHLDQHVHAKRERGVFQIAGRGIVDRRHDD